MTKKMIVENFATAEEFFVHWPAVARLADRGEQIAEAAVRAEWLNLEQCRADGLHDAKTLSPKHRVESCGSILHGGERK